MKKVSLSSLLVCFLILSSTDAFANRKKITISDTLPEIINAITENNSGAAVVLEELSKKLGVFTLPFMLRLDTLNIRGPQLWFAYSHFAGEDINVLQKSIRDQDPNMIKAVNDGADQGAFGPDFKERAGQPPSEN